jgi:hypothetical protein
MLQAASGDAVHVTGGGQEWAAPKSLGQLMDVLGQNRHGIRERSGQPPPRIVAGNTGAGVYKDWPSSHEGIIVDVTRGAEMRVLERNQVRVPCLVLATAWRQSAYYE